MISGYRSSSINWPRIPRCYQPTTAIVQRSHEGPDPFQCVASACSGSGLPARCLLTLVSLAYPEWGFSPQKFDVAYALLQAIEGLDLVRAQLLVDIVYQNGLLNSFDTIRSEIKERITYVFGARYEIIRNWLSEYALHGSQQLDHFISSLFGEVLSQPGFGFHSDNTNYPHGP